ncbi:MAG TPA: TonB-dependent receptor [Acidobacteriaceae bacterium]|nr:TonB-dependent receptor [Acidobacteriaceae bacterium]
MRVHPRFVVYCLATFTFLLLGLPAFAQNTEASLTGQVLDPSGATIASAKVTVTNAGTGIARSVQSNSSGRYLVTNLNPGAYNVSVEASGFTTKVLTGITLEVGQAGSLDVPMSLGQSSENVEVTGEASVTDTESSSVGTVVDNKEVVGLPLNQRTFYSLALLSPAAYLPAQNSTLGFRGGFNVAGNNETANTFTINGIEDDDQNVMAPSFRPSVEAIQEFKLLTGVYSAEYGRTSGGQVVVITKGGTNQFHGDGFEFFRNQFTDARNFFLSPGAPAPFQRNQYGGTIGGPIIKDRTFFFLSYEGMRLSQGVIVLGAVPLPAMHNGDFSSLLSKGIQLKNPRTGVPYAGNIIPRSAWSNLGSQLINLYPAPDSPTSQTYTLNGLRTENLDEGSARVDHKISDKDTILAQYNYFNDPAYEPSNPLCGSNQLPGFGCYTNQISTLVGINETHIFNAHWLNEFRVGLDRLEQPRIGQDANSGFPSVPGAFSDPSVPKGLNGGAPNTLVAGLSTIHPYTNLPQHRWDNHYNLVDNVSWSKGSNEFKFGINFMQARYTDLFLSYGTGQLNFNTASTAGAGAPTSGNSIADLLLGYGYDSTRVPTAPDFHVIYSQYAGYFEDDWKILPNLMLNLGMRYEYFSPTRDAHNVLSNFQPSNNTMIVEGQPGVGSYLYGKDLNNFGPRIGLAYQPMHNNKTVVHAAYGAFYNSPAIGNGANLSMAIQVPFRLGQTLFSSAAQPLQIDTNPFPVGANTPNGSASKPYTGITPTGMSQNFRTMYVNEWAADVQQQLTPTIALTIGYMGSATSKIPRSINLNQGIVTSVVGNKVTSVRPITPAGSAPSCITYPVSQCYLFGNITYYISEGQGSYNALTVKAQKDYGKGLSFIASYTWAKSIDNANGYASGSQSSEGTPQDSHNLNAERGLSDFNVAQRLVLSPVWELPFGKNQMFLNSGIGSALAGGWQLSSVAQFDSGRPFTIYNSATNNSGSFNFADRPNETGNPNNGPRTVGQWFNTSVFSSNAPGTFGNAPRNNIIGPDFINIDMALQRSFPIKERYTAMFRFEVFNVANKPNFLNPLGSGTGEFGTPLFGQITAANDPRQMQFSGKLVF